MDQRRGPDLGGWSDEGLNRGERSDGVRVLPAPGDRWSGSPTALPATTHVALVGVALLVPAREGAAVVGRAAVAVLTALIAVYRRGISPLLGPRCRFHPTCSAYALDALRARGLLRGTLMTLVRLAKCGPWHPGGLDPVSPRAHRRIGPGAPITEEQAP